MKKVLCTLKLIGLVGNAVKPWIAIALMTLNINAALVGHSDMPLAWSSLATVIALVKHSE